MDNDLTENAVSSSEIVAHATNVVLYDLKSRLLPLESHVVPDRRTILLLHCHPECLVDLGEGFIVPRDKLLSGSISLRRYATLYVFLLPQEKDQRKGKENR